VHRRHLRPGSRVGEGRGAAGAVHRAQRRLRSRAARARERDSDGGALRPRATRGRRARLGDHRVRGARAIRGPEAEELLVRHDGEARLRRDDARRRGRLPVRRGAGGRRRGIPAQVRLPLHALARGRQDDRARHPRPEEHRALLQPGAPPPPRAGGHDRRAGSRRRALRGADGRAEAAAGTRRRARSRRSAGRAAPAPRCRGSPPAADRLRSGRSSSRHACDHCRSSAPRPAASSC
jgi:hypothetical protein